MVHGLHADQTLAVGFLVPSLGQTEAFLCSNADELAGMEGLRLGGHFLAKKMSHCCTVSVSFGMCVLHSVRSET